MPAITLSSIALSTAIGWGKSGAQKLGVAGYKKVAERLHRGKHDETDAVLKATHMAYVDAMDAMALAARKTAMGEDEEAAAKAFKDMVDGEAFREFREGEQFPLDQTNSAIDRIFGASLGDAEAVERAYNQLVVADLLAWGADLPDWVVRLFVEGVGGYDPWDVVFQRAFRSRIGNDGLTFRLLTLDGIGDLRAIGASLLVGQAEQVERFDEFRAASLSARGAQQRIEDNLKKQLDTANQKITELERARADDAKLLADNLATISKQTTILQSMELLLSGFRAER